MGSGGTPGTDGVTDGGLLTSLPERRGRTVDRVTRRAPRMHEAVWTLDGWDGATNAARPIEDGGRELYHVDANM